MLILCALQTVDFSVRATSKLDEFRSEIIGRHVKEVVLGADSTLQCPEEDMDVREAFYLEVLPLLPAVRELTLLGEDMLLPPSSTDGSPFLPPSFNNAVTHLTFLNDADEVLEPSSIAELLPCFPNLVHLACKGVGPSTTDAFTLAVQSLHHLTSLSFTQVEAFDATFAFSTSWTASLTDLHLVTVSSPQLALPFLLNLNFSKTLTSLQIYFDNSEDADLPVHSLSNTPLPPSLTHCEINIRNVELTTGWIPLSLSPLVSLVVTGMMNHESFWDVLNDGTFDLRSRATSQNTSSRAEEPRDRSLQWRAFPRSGTTITTCVHAQPLDSRTANDRSLRGPYALGSNSPAYNPSQCRPNGEVGRSEP